MAVKKKIKENDGIEELNLLTRVYMTLKHNDVDLVLDLTNKCACELLRFKQFGWKSLESVIDQLRENNFNLSKCNAYKRDE